MTVLTTHAAWVLIAAFVLSLGYEAYRVTLKAGASRHRRQVESAVSQVPSVGSLGLQ